MDFELPSPRSRLPRLRRSLALRRIGAGGLGLDARLRLIDAVTSVRGPALKLGPSMCAMRTHTPPDAKSAGGIEALMRTSRQGCVEPVAYVLGTLTFSFALVSLRHRPA